MRMAAMEGQNDDSTSLMLWPFNTVLHVVLTPTIKLSSEQLHKCNLATVTNHNYLIDRLSDMQSPWKGCSTPKGVGTCRLRVTVLVSFCLWDSRELDNASYREFRQDWESIGTHTYNTHTHTHTHGPGSVNSLESISGSQECHLVQVCCGDCSNGKIHLQASANW